MNKSHANRGMDFEKKVEKQCWKYKQQGIALIHKIPTSIKVIRKGARIVSAFHEDKSNMVDYIGVYNGKAIAIECKETSNKTSFSFSNIKEHQLEFLKDWCNISGLGYYLVHFKEHQKVFLVAAKDMQNCIDSIGRKSAPFSWFTNNSIEVEDMDFLKHIN